MYTKKTSRSLVGRRRHKRFVRLRPPWRRWFPSPPPPGAACPRHVAPSASIATTSPAGSSPPAASRTSRASSSAAAATTRFVRAELAPAVAGERALLLLRAAAQAVQAQQPAQAPQLRGHVLLRLAQRERALQHVQRLPEVAAARVQHDGANERERLRDELVVAALAVRELERARQLGFGLLRRAALPQRGVPRHEQRRGLVRVVGRRRLVRRGARAAAAASSCRCITGRTRLSARLTASGDPSASSDSAPQTHARSRVAGAPNASAVSAAAAKRTAASASWPTE